METNVIEQKLKHIAYQYLRSQNYLLSNPQPIKRNYSLIFKSYFVQKVETAYSSLSSSLQMIINNDFFYQDYPGWWKGKYTAKQYRRLKKKAMNQFMEAYYETIN